MQGVEHPPASSPRIILEKWNMRFVHNFIVFVILYHPL